MTGRENDEDVKEFEDLEHTECWSEYKNQTL